MPGPSLFSQHNQSQGLFGATPTQQPGYPSFNLSQPNPSYFGPKPFPYGQPMQYMPNYYPNKFSGVGFPNTQFVNPAGMAMPPPPSFGSVFHSNPMMNTPPIGGYLKPLGAYAPPLGVHAAPGFPSQPHLGNIFQLQKNDSVFSNNSQDETPLVFPGLVKPPFGLSPVETDEAMAQT
jgi:hypothetical protein